MDTELLVENRIDDGQKLLAELIRTGFDVTAAFWARTSAEGLWFLFIGSTAVHPGAIGDVYRAVYVALSRIPDSGISLSEIKVLATDDPTIKDVQKIQKRYSGRTLIRFGGARLGDVGIEEAYIYPPPAPFFKGFDEIKRRFPSAEIFTITVPSLGQNIGSLLQSVSLYLGKINEAEFEGKAPGTLLFMGPEGSSGQPLAKLGFVYRPEGWNTLFRPETQRWEEVVQAATGKKLYESADFSPLAAMKVQD